MLDDFFLMKYMIILKLIKSTSPSIRMIQGQFKVNNKALQLHLKGN